ncbi:unnamed protein product [Clavelina lepadiformis]|uniref:Little elongation complex subunit 1 C-terminal domain-containing protein n=1 Tax=Clavelina lepadiformis TaxID=159417 RepID=A0ABP0FNR1_CLALP
MEEFISLGLDDVTTTISLTDSESTTMPLTESTQDGFKWCDSCREYGQMSESRFKKNMGKLKKKIIFTDNLINLFNEAKLNLEQSQKQVQYLEQKCKKKEADNQLVQTQLKAILDDRNPSELQMQKEHILQLENTIQHLNDEIKSMDMTRMMLEDKIHLMRKDESKKVDTKKQHAQEIDQLHKENKKLQKAIKSLERENHQLHRKTEVLQDRIRRGGYRRTSGSISQQTDSEQNMSMLSEEATKTENEEQSNVEGGSNFKSPLPEKKKKKRKKRKSVTTDLSDNDDDAPSTSKHSARENLEIKKEENKGKDVLDDTNTVKEKVTGAATKEAKMETQTSESDKNKIVSSSDETAKHSYVVTNKMKARMFEMKAMRSFRAFSRRLSSAHKEDISVLIDHLNNDSSFAQREITQFCQKHMLVGYEVLVAKRIIKLNQESFESAALEAMQLVENTNPNKVPPMQPTHSHVSTPPNNQNTASGSNAGSRANNKLDDTSSDHHAKSAEEATKKSSQSIAEDGVNSNILKSINELSSKENKQNYLLLTAPDKQPKQASSTEITKDRNDSGGKANVETIKKVSSEEISSTKGLFSSDEDDDVTVNIQSVNYETPPEDVSELSSHPEKKELVASKVLALDRTEKNIKNASQTLARKMQLPFQRRRKEENLDAADKHDALEDAGEQPPRKIRTRSVSRTLSESSLESSDVNSIAAENADAVKTGTKILKRNKNPPVKESRTKAEREETEPRNLTAQELQTSKVHIVPKVNSTNEVEKDDTASSPSIQLKLNTSADDRNKEFIDDRDKVTVNDPTESSSEFDSVSSVADNSLSEEQSLGKWINNNENAKKSQDSIASNKAESDITCNSTMSILPPNDVGVTNDNNSGKEITLSVGMNKNLYQNPDVVSTDLVASKVPAETDISMTKVTENLKPGSNNTVSLIPSTERYNRKRNRSSSLEQETVPSKQGKREDKKQLFVEEKSNQISNVAASKKPKFTHPVLASMMSLPFTVGQESPDPTVDPNMDFSFLPDLHSDSKESDDVNEVINLGETFLSKSSSPDLDEILLEMRIDIPLSPFDSKTNSTVSKPPSSSDDSSSPLEGDNPEMNAEDDSRIFISPSSILCTALSFSSKEAAKSTPSTSKVENQAKTKRKEKEIPKKRKITGTKSDTTSLFSQGKKGSKVSRLRDAPRRFSCEAPTLARPVPSIKPIVKTQSFDPTLSNPSEAASSSLETDSSAISGNPIVLRNTSAILTHTSSGAFKPVLSQSNKGKQIPSLMSIEKEKTMSKVTQDTPKAQTPVSEITAEISHARDDDDDDDDDEHLLRDVDNIVSSMSIEALVENFSDDEKKQKAEACSPKLSASGSAECSTSQQLAQKPKEEFWGFVEKIDGDLKKYEHLLLDVLKEIQASAISSSTDKRPKITPKPALTWFLKIVPYSATHSLQCVADILSKFSNSGKVPMKELLHEWEFNIVTMISVVCRIRQNKGEVDFIEKVVLPILLKAICSFGDSLPHFKVHFAELDTMSIMMPFLCDLKHRRSNRRKQLTMDETLSLVRMYAGLCRSNNDPYALLGLYRYCFLSSSLKKITYVFLHGLLCYPDAALHHFPLTSHLILLSLKEMYMVTHGGTATMVAKKFFIDLENLLGWHDPASAKDKGSKNPDAGWIGHLEECMSNIEKAELIDVVDENGTTSRGLKIESMKDILSALEVFAAVKGVAFVSKQIIDGKFWPWLNAWSQHLVCHANNEDNKQVSDGCMIAVLRGLTTVLLTMMTQQKLDDANQPVMTEAVSYFETICALLTTFTKQYKETAPVHVQCATALTVLQLAFCKPVVAHSALYNWFLAHAREDNEEEEDEKEMPSKKKKGKQRVIKLHPLMPQICAFYPRKSLRKLICWLEGQVKGKKKFGLSMTKLVWGA